MTNFWGQNKTTTVTPSNLHDGYPMVALLWSSIIFCCVFCICSIIMTKCFNFIQSRWTFCIRLNIIRARSSPTSSPAHDDDASTTQQDLTTSGDSRTQQDSNTSDDSRSREFNIFTRRSDAIAPRNSTILFLKRGAPPPYDVAVTMSKPDIILHGQKHSAEKRNAAYNQKSFYDKASEESHSYETTRQYSLNEQSPSLVVPSGISPLSTGESQSSEYNYSLSNRSASTESSNLATSNQSHVTNGASNVSRVHSVVYIEMNENRAFSMDEELPSYASVAQQSSSSTV